jgi:hypothetical protein
MHIIFAEVFVAVPVVVLKQYVSTLDALGFPSNLHRTAPIAPSAVTLHTGADEKIPELNEHEQRPVPALVQFPLTQSPLSFVVAHEPAEGAAILILSILSAPVELLVTDPTNTGAGRD